MKTLSIQQPWASLIVAGIKDVENRTWKTPFRGKVLIHTGTHKVPSTFYNKIYNEWRHVIDNHIAYGNFPELCDLPTSAIIGYATLVGFTDEGSMSDSIWDGGPDQTKWHLEDAHVFDEPILGVKGKLNLWDYPELDENNLPPAHKVEFALPRLEGREVVMPVCEDLMEVLDKNPSCFRIGLDETLEFTSQLLPNPDSWDSVSVDTIRFEHNGKSICHKVKAIDVINLLDDKGKVEEGYSLYEPEPVPVHYLTFYFE